MDQCSRIYPDPECKNVLASIESKVTAPEAKTSTAMTRITSDIVRLYSTLILHFSEEEIPVVMGELVGRIVQMYKEKQKDDTERIEEVRREASTVSRRSKH